MKDEIVICENTSTANESAVKSSFFKKEHMKYYVIGGVLIALFIVSLILGGLNAKNIALNHAGLSNNDVRYVDIDFEFDDLLPKYDVSFYNQNVEHEYEINGLTGTILSLDVDYN